MKFQPWPPEGSHNIKKMSPFVLSVRPLEPAKSGFGFIVQFTSWKDLCLSSLKLTWYATFKKK